MERNPTRKLIKRFTAHVSIAVVIATLICGATGIIEVNLSVPCSTSVVTGVPRMAITPAPRLWNVSWGGTSDDRAYSVWGDGARVYSAGWTLSFGKGDHDFALVTCNQTTGARLANVTWGGAGDDEAYAVWGDGTRVYTVGWTNSFGLGSYDFAFVTWDRITGARLANVTWGGAGDDEAYAVWGDGARVYTAGWTNSFGLGNYDFALVAWNGTTGTRLWNVTWGGVGNDFCTSVWGDGARLYTAGYTSSFGIGVYNFALVAWDPMTGARLWNATWGGKGNDEANSVWGDGTRIYTAGLTSSFGNGFTNFAIVAWDPMTGARLWNSTWGGAGEEDGLGVWGDGARVYTAGTTSSFGTGIRNFALVAWDPASGSFLWSTTWGGTEDDEGNSLWGDGNRLYSAGYVYSFGAGFADFALVAWDVHFTVSHPSDFDYEAGTTDHKITWDISSATTSAGDYSVSSNGILYTSGTWTSDQSVVIPVDNFAAGTYIFTLSATDGFGGQLLDTVIFTVIATTVPSSEWTILDTIFALFLGIICMLFAFTLWRSRFRSLHAQQGERTLKNQSPNLENVRKSGS